MAATIQGTTGWQYDMTALECHLYMLENEVGTDICFEVGPTDDTAVLIRAHKYVLSARSEVFEAMFNSGMAESNICQDNKIRITDVDADVFKDFLKYLYCDQASFTPESAFPLIYTAKKYMLPKLVRMCRQSLEESLNVSTARSLLEQSLIFDEQQLASKCLKFIAKHSDSFLSGTELLSAPLETIEVILGCDELRSRESLVYEFCLRWAKQQLLSNHGVETPADEQIRATLGCLLYQIRFPIMGSEEFAEIVRQRDILTSEEKLSVYDYMSTRNGAEQLLFSSKKRNPFEELCVDRIAKCVEGYWSCSPDIIDFRADQDILLTGIGVYSGNYDYKADVKVLDGGSVCYSNTVSVPHTGESVPHKISIGTPVAIKAGALYTISLCRPRNDVIAYYGETCHRTNSKGNVNFTFSTCSDPSKRKQSLTCEAFGQIPCLYFKS